MMQILSIHIMPLQSIIFYFFFSMTFDAKDLPAGFYFYRLQAGMFTATKKTILIK